jgi:hypothetical protein
MDRTARSASTRIRPSALPSLAVRRQSLVDDKHEGNIDTAIMDQFFEPPEIVEITENDLLNVVHLAQEIDDKTPAEIASLHQLIAALEFHDLKRGGDDQRER